ncbi:MAG: helix-turn-helix domain-containing protein [SAR324 cluster bacterium]|nr:helix-turn-helix domain-containing protein [SAR324 cluster bacterium]
MSEKSSSQLQELLSVIGPKLKAAREAKDLTIQEVSSRTRINPVFLANIEQAQTENLPGLTFVRGFIRNFLQVLELQDEEIEAEIKRIASMDEYISQTALGPEINAMHGDEDVPAVSTQKLVVTGVVLILIVVGTYSGVRFLSGSSGEPPVPLAVTEKLAEAPAAPPDDLASPAPEARPTPPPTVKQTRPKPSVPLEASQNLRLTVRGLEPTWIRLSVDRAPPIEVRLEPAETMNWEANEEIRLVIGKSHGVAVYLNGEDILLPEERGQLIPDIVLNKLTLLRLEN